MILTLKEKVWWFAVCSRSFVLLTSALLNFIIPDHVADAFIAPKPNNVQESYGDLIVQTLFGGLVRWDAQYFMHIAMYGYTYENCLAFFPLFPLLCRTIANVLNVVLGGILCDLSSCMLSSLTINFICFVKCATLLHELSLQVLRNERLAYIAAILYCLNPASIFFSAPYSESLYACLTFYGMLKCACGFKKKFSMNCGIVFGLGTITRSNGILNIGFIVYKYLHNFVRKSLPKFSQEIQESRENILWMLPIMFVRNITIILPYLMSIVFSLLPFLTYQAYSYYKYCIPYNITIPDFLVSFAKANNFVLPGDPPQEESHWCKTPIPFSYSYIQSHYWNVGFLKYYQWKQVPNFMLAFPVIGIILSESYMYVVKYSDYCMHLGLCNSVNVRKSIPKNRSFHEKDSGLREEIFPYVMHAVCFTLFCLFCVHIQVATRLLSSSSPVLYWFCAKIVSEESNLKKKKSRTKNKNVFYNIESMENMSSRWKIFMFDAVPTLSKKNVVYLYFLLYMIVGTALFSNFLPWT